MFYLYSSSQWKDQLTSYNGQSITYDASGNPINYFGAVLTWEGQRLKSYTPETTSSGRVNAYTYNYDENGMRTRKTVGNTVTDYYYNGSLLMGMVRTTTNSNGSTETSMQRFSYDANGKVVAVNYNGTYYYYLRNAQGDIVKLIDRTGAAVVEYTYDSWGKLLSNTGSLSEIFGKEQPFRYRGYVYDEETGFYYLQSRYYNPEVRRFISPDVYLSTGQGVLGHNAYAYCGNNAIKYSDICGNSWITDFIEDVAAAIENLFIVKITTVEVESIVTDLPDPLPITATTGTELIYNGLELNSGFVEVNINRSSSWKKSSIGLNINIGAASVSFSFGISNIGISAAYAQGDRTSSFGVVTNLSELKIGLEQSTTMHGTIYDARCYSNASISGMGIAFAYALATSNIEFALPQFNSTTVPGWIFGNYNFTK